MNYDPYLILSFDDDKYIVQSKNYIESIQIGNEIQIIDKKIMIRITNDTLNDQINKIRSLIGLTLVELIDDTCISKKRCNPIICYDKFKE